MAKLAITYEIVTYQQFSVLPNRAATDLVFCVVHDIEEARSQDWASIFVTLDVQGAFDAVLHNQLIWLLHSRGWPTQILGWIT